MKDIRLKFGILIDTDLNNKCRLQGFNILGTYKKLDAYAYIKEISDSFEDIEHETECFSEEAAMIKGKDSPFGRTEFSLVCYAADDEGNILRVKKIKDLYF